jgi:hypothetical protein
MTEQHLVRPARLSCTVAAVLAFLLALAAGGVQAAEAVAWKYVYPGSNGNCGDQQVTTGTTDAAGNVYTGGYLANAFTPNHPADDRDHRQAAVRAHRRPDLPNHPLRFP